MQGDDIDFPERKNSLKQRQPAFGPCDNENIFQEKPLRKISPREYQIPEHVV